MNKRSPLDCSAAMARHRILLVDDDSNVLASYKRGLRRRFRIDTAYGGESALAMLSQEGTYSVVVADCLMPRMDGMEFLKLAKQRSPGTVRIMLTGNADLALAMRAVNETNVFRFLVKPCDPEVFARALEDAQAHFYAALHERDRLHATLRKSINELSQALGALEAGPEPKE